MLYCLYKITDSEKSGYETYLDSCPLKAYDGIFLNPKTEQQYGLPALAERAKLDRWARAQQG